MARDLNDKQSLFCQEYIVDHNATKAAMRAGYSEKTAYSMGHELLKKPEIGREIAKLQEKRVKRTEITADRVLQEIASVAFANMSDYLDWDAKGVRVVPKENLTREQMAGISEISKGRDGVRIKTHPKMDALINLAKIHNLIGDKTPAVLGNLEVLGALATALRKTVDQKTAQVILAELEDSLGQKGEKE